MRTSFFAVLGGFALAAAVAAGSTDSEASANGLSNMLDSVEARAALIQRSDAMASLVAEASPSVVSIAVSRSTQERLGSPFGSRSGQERRSGAGSGVVVDATGLIVTNHHVVRDATDLLVVFADGREFTAEVVGSDPATDIALIRVNATDERFPALRVSETDARPGEMVFAIGNPFGLSSSVSAGIVSAIGRDQTGLTDFGDFIQTDAAINPGNSGGALVNARGELIGINTAIYSRSGGSQGIGFAIPSTLVSEIATALEADGYVSRGWLGVSISDVESGVRMEYVAPSGPAATAGLRAGNVVRQVGGHAVADADELRMLIASYPPGEVVALIIDGKTGPMALDVVLGERPAHAQLSAFAQERRR
ncbi:MAG: S1-C subfamily serine protease [Bradymonadia bacterium]|jgi:S1-C subfamily serine protease